MKTLRLSLLALAASVLPLAAAPFDLGAAAPTPYDKYMSPVKSTLTQLDGSRPTIDKVRALVREGRSFRYSFTTPYVASSPVETAARRSGDCKDKALWLADQLNDPTVRFVIGKARSNSRISHAWLYWKDDANRWWILDCTNLREPVQVDRAPRNTYIPQYSFAKNGSFRHGAETATASRVAGKRAKSPVAAN